MPKRSNKNFANLRFVAQQPLGALASVTAVGARIFGGDFTTSLFVMSIDCSWNIENWTHTALDGPVVCGFYHNDFTVAQVKEALEVSVLGTADKTEQEFMNRMVRIVGTIVPKGAVGDVISEDLGEGQRFRTKLNWVIEEDHAINWFLYNQGSGAMTTGAVGNIAGQLYGRWMP